MTRHCLLLLVGVMVAFNAAAQSAMPRFQDFPATDVFRGSPAAPLLGSARYGGTFRTRLRDGARKGPNFAGAFTIVMWGCGSPCQYLAVIDARTGALSKQTLQTATGATYRVDSRLLIVDPRQPDYPPPGECAACGTEAAYVWNGTRFEPVGKGPHPHIRDDSLLEPR